MTMPADGPLSLGRLILIRHAETDHNVERRLCGWTDSALSTRGSQQTLRLAEHVAAAYRLDRVYASPLQRAWLTAQAIGARSALVPQPIDDLREIHFGHLEGLTWAQFQADHPEAFSQWRDSADQAFRWPGGESRHEFNARVRRSLAFIEVESHTRHVAVVSHGGVIAAYLALRLAGDAARWSEFAVHNCSVTELAWRAGRPHVVGHNLVAHLGDLCPV
jgi:broad specificity phosphatase PhoE